MKLSVNFDNLIIINLMEYEFMLTLEDLSIANNLDRCFSSTLKNTLQNSLFTLKLLLQFDPEIDDADALVEATFPEGECEEYKPSNLFACHEELLVLACMRNGIVMGLVALSFDKEESYCDIPFAQIHTMAIDEDHRDKRLGSLLMIAVNDICMSLQTHKISLISSEAGEHFYRSFGFESLAHRAYEVSLPFKKETVSQKLKAYMQKHPTTTPGLASSFRLFPNQQQLDCEQKPSNQMSQQPYG